LTTIKRISAELAALGYESGNKTMKEKANNFKLCGIPALPFGRIASLGTSAATGNYPFLGPPKPRQKVMGVMPGVIKYELREITVIWKVSRQEKVCGPARGLRPAFMEAGFGGGKPCSMDLAGTNPLQNARQSAKTRSADNSN
jgi:hypothetical protein